MKYSKSSLYQQTAASRIPFEFIPIPRYFHDSGWFKSPKSAVFIIYCFTLCSKEEKRLYHDHREIALPPYHFIFGRKSFSISTGLTEDEIRTQQKKLEKAGLLKKAPNETPNRFTIYKWEIERFIKNTPQQNPQLSPKYAPVKPHKQVLRNKEKEEITISSERFLDLS